MIRPILRSLRTVTLSVALAGTLLLTAVLAAVAVMVLGCYLALVNPAPPLWLRLLNTRRE